MKKWKAIAVATGVGMITVGGMAVNVSAASTNQQRYDASTSGQAAYTTTMGGFTSTCVSATYPGAGRDAAAAAVCTDPRTTK